MSFISTKGLTKDFPLGKTTVHALRGIDLDIDKAELLRRINGLGGGDGHSVPTVWLHGVAFRYTSSGENQN